MAIILFDFDGVLADTMEDMLNFARASCEQMGLPRTPTPADLDALETMSFVDYGKQLKLPSNHIEEFVSRCLEMFEQRTKSPKIFDGIAQVVIQTAENHTIGIITGNTAQTVENFLKENRLQDCIKLIIGVEQPGSKPEKIRRALQEIGRPGSTAYMIGDSASDIFAARLASIKSIAVGWGHQSISKLIQANPDYLVKTPRELQELLSGC